MSNSFKSFEELECWKAGRDLRITISNLTKKFPSDEKYSLIDQMKRSSRSVTYNIAEGFGRFHFQENIQFCRHSRGSLHELMDQLIICLEEKYITEVEYQTTRELINKTIGILNGYINYLKRAKEAVQLNK